MNYIVEVIKKEAMTFNSDGFNLRSGEKSQYYIDCRKITLDSFHLFWISQQFQAILEDIRLLGNIDAIGGPALGAAPLVSGILMTTKKKLSGFLVRKESKEHGLSGRIVGPLQKNQNCVIVEDVVTSGKSVLDTIQVVEEFGAKVIYVLAIVDRLQGCREKLQEKEIPFISLTTINDLL